MRRALVALAALAVVGAAKADTFIPVGQSQGPTFVVEFLNMQADSANNPANHIHSVWRKIKGDFVAMVRRD